MDTSNTKESINRPINGRTFYLRNLSGWNRSRMDHLHRKSIGSAASDPEPAYRQRAIEWWEKNIQNTISGLGDDFATWRKVCLRIRLIRRNKLFGDWKMARPVCIRICWMLWLWPCKRHVVPSWTLTHEKLCRNRHSQIVRLTESRTFFDFYFSQFFAKIGVFTSSILRFVSTLFKIK